jgi:aspartyl-tRNA(Asn)/glutamyl-tRNA(Gln) amidotransferase subunit A
MTDLTRLTIKQASAGLHKGDFTSLELTEQHISAMEAQRDLNAFITETPEIARERAQQSDKKIKAGTAGKLEGIPVAVKDLFCTNGVLTTSASHILDGFTPTYESTVSAKLQEAGGVMLGKTNMDEFAMGSANITSHYGPVKNPWKREGNDTPLVPGGSSGGSAASVASFTSMGALGSDTGGSIRQPASFCGIVGIKPTYGRCSRWGMVAFASSLDQAGVFTRTVEDAAIMLETIVGYDPKDSTSYNAAVPDFSKALTGDVRGMRIGIPREYNVDVMPQEIRALWEQGADWLKQAGAEIIDINLPHTEYALSTYYIIAPAEASSNLARYDGVRYGLRVTGEKGSLDEMYEKTRAAGFGDEVKRRIMIGTYVLSAGYYDAYYKQAQRIRSLIAQDFSQAFGKVDAILTPTAPSAAFELGKKIDDPVQMYLNDIFTIPASLAGLPALSLPAGLSSEGLPLGLHLIGKPFDEATLFKVAGVMEQAAQFKATPF